MMFRLSNRSLSTVLLDLSHVCFLLAESYLYLNVMRNDGKHSLIQAIFEDRGIDGVG